MNKILIVDDEPSIVSVLREYANFNGIDSDYAYDGETAIDLVANNNYDCIILDIMMPGMDGYMVLKEIRKIKLIPVIMCSAKGEEYDKLKAFELGVDDYICKPFSPKEVFARVKAILKRTHGFAELIDSGKMKLDLNSHKVYICDELVDLTNKEYELLLLFIKNKGVVLSRECILNEVWGYDYECDERTVDAHVKMLRKHLGECGDYIKTEHGVGYRFEICG